MTDPHALYLDAAKQSHQRFIVCAVTGEERIINAAVVKPASVVEAEEVAVAFAIRDPLLHTVLSDPKRAVTNLYKGMVGKEAARILHNCAPEHVVELIWVPAHSANPGIEEANRVVRGLTYQEVGPSEPVSLSEAPITYHDIMNCYKERRLIYPPLHADLSKTQARILRRIQTRSIPIPHRLSLITNGEYDPTCQNFYSQELATQDHILWGCEAKPPRCTLLPASSQEYWNQLLMKH